MKERKGDVLMTDSLTPDNATAIAVPTSLIGLSWQEQDPALRDMWMQNKTPQQIGEALGRSVPAIMTRAARLGLPRRAAPGRKSGMGTAPRPLPSGDTTPSAQRRAMSAFDAEPKSQASLRVCLMCLKKFESAGRHNRICSPCKGTAEYGLAGALPDVHLPQG